MEYFLHHYRDEEQAPVYCHSYPAQVALHYHRVLQPFFEMLRR